MMTSSRRRTRFRCALAVGAALGLLTVREAPAETGGAARVLVMPFESGGEPRTWWLGEASAMLLADGLRAVGVDAIGRDERLRAFGRLQVPPVASLSHGSVIRVGQLVGATAVVIGSVDVQDDSLVVKARSMRLDTGRLQAEVEERGGLTDLFEVYARTARRLHPGGGGAASREDAPSPPPLAAFENFIKGLLAETPASQVAFLEKALALHERYDRARLALWRAHTDADDHEKALAAVAAVPETSTYSRRARFAAGYSELALRRFDDAFTRFQALGDELPAAEIFSNLGAIQLRRGAMPHTGRATYWFSKATQTSPSEGDYFFNLGYAYWFEQDVQAAIYWLREAVRRNPADGDAHFVLGAALQAAGSTTEAAREMELADRLSGAYAAARRKAGERVPSGLERVRQALEPPGARADNALVATAQREQRELASFHLERGRRLVEAENDREAIAELRRALYLSPYLAEAHLLLGRIYMRSGLTREAIDALKIAIWSEETAAARLALAEAWVLAKEVEAARREAERALALDPELTAARELLQRLSQR